MPRHAVVLVVAAVIGCGDGDKGRPLGESCAADDECGSGACLVGQCLEPDGDEDLDQLPNRVEVALGTDLRDPDSDGDGLGDRAEVADDLSARDEDGDGVNDALESAVGDADGDCVPDQKDPAPTSRDAVIAAVCPSVGVCAADGLAFTCDKGPVCDYAAVVDHEASETRCDGLDNDCDGATDETPDVQCPPAITVTPERLDLEVGESAGISVTVTFPDRTEDLSSTTVWVPRDSGIVSVEGGVVSALAVGETVLDAQIGPVARAVAVSVRAAPIVLSALAIAPDAPSLPLGLGLTLTARGIFSDGHEEDLAAVAWASSKPAVAAIDDGGRLIARTLGTTTVTARVGDVSATTLVTVVAPIPVGLDLTAPDTRFAFDEVLPLSALAALSDGGSQDVSAAVVWRTSDVARATVDAQGLVTGHAPGPVEITAALGELEATLPLLVVVTRSPLVVATPVRALLSAPTALTVISPASRVVATSVRVPEPTGPAPLPIAPIMARPFIRASPP